MNTVYSKAFWLGRNANIIAYVRAMGGGDAQKLQTMKHFVETFAKSLNIEVGDIPALTSAETIEKLRESIRLDLAMVQSEFVARCFDFGFNFSSWANFRGGYAFDDKTGATETAGVDLGQVEAKLRAQASEVGLSTQLEKCLAAAKDPRVSSETFKELVGMEIVLDMTAKLDRTDPGSLSKDTGSKELFVVMPMIETDPGLVDVIDAIQETASSLGLAAYRVDQLDTSGRITDSIVQGLKSAPFVVVDLTHSRPNVYWEAGFTHGLGKIPIYIARKGTHLEFDIKDYPVIYYANMKELRDGLFRRLRQQAGLNPAK